MNLHSAIARSPTAVNLIDRCSLRHIVRGTGSSRRCELFVTAALFVAVHDGRAESKVM